MLNVHLDTRPIHIGERRLLSADGDGPFVVEIKCFVKKPPPGSYRPCPECGKFDFQAGEQVEIMASPDAFTGNGDKLNIIVTNAIGERELFSLHVLERLIKIKPFAFNPSESSGGSNLMEA